MGIQMKQGQYRGGVAWHACIFAFLALAAARTGVQVQRAALPPKAGEVTLNLDPTQSGLHWTLGTTLHAVHGTFALQRGFVRFDPASGYASGEFDVDAASGESGNDSRDRKMQRDILDSSRFTEVTFRPNRIEGKLSAQGASSVQVHGTFFLHGEEHELTVQVQAQLTGNRWEGSAKFGVPYVQWGLKTPNTFLLKADPIVEIGLEMKGTLQGILAR